MRNFILALAFMLVGTFAFANTSENIKSVQIESTQEVNTSVETFENINNLDITEKADLKIKIRIIKKDGDWDIEIEIKL